MSVGDKFYIQIVGVNGDQFFGLRWWVSVDRQFFGLNSECHCQWVTEICSWKGLNHVHVGLVVKAEQSAKTVLLTTRYTTLFISNNPVRFNDNNPAIWMNQRVGVVCHICSQNHWRCLPTPTHRTDEFDSWVPGWVVLLVHVLLVHMQHCCMV